MSVNNLTWEQSATVLNSIARQATGQSGLTATNTSDFVSIAQMVLKTGYDTVLNSISQVLSRTIFSTRPYTRQLSGLETDSVRYGAIVRKLSPIDMDYVDDERYNPEDGDSPDMFAIRKPKVLQTNFYGATPDSNYISIFQEQLDQAFRNAEEFGAFISMVMQNMSDKLEQGRENMCRMLLTNAIGGKILSGQNVYHVLTAYNTETGQTLDKDDIYLPANYAPFMRWLDGFIGNLSHMMTQRSTLYHTNITGKPVMRHTPVQDQKIYISSKARFDMKSQVLSTTYNDKYLSLSDYEPIAYWQSISEPNKISVTANYLVTADGTVGTGEVLQDNVFGIMFDRDAIGYTTINQYIRPTPFNPRGAYYNLFYAQTYRWWTDYTENIIALILD